MLAGDRAGGIAEQPVHRLDRPAGDDRQRAVHRVSQRGQGFRQTGGHDHRIRRRREVDQRAVHIEQQRGAMEWRQRVHGLCCSRSREDRRSDAASSTPKARPPASSHRSRASPDGCRSRPDRRRRRPAGPAGRTTQAFTVMVNDPKVADCPTLIVSAVAWAFTLSSACSFATPAGTQTLGRSTVAGGVGVRAVSWAGRLVLRIRSRKTRGREGRANPAPGARAFAQAGACGIGACGTGGAPGCWHCCCSGGSGVA